MFGLKGYSFRFDALPDEAARQLRATLARPDFKLIVADWADERVTLYRKLPWWFHNSFNPIFVGRFEATPGGTTLTGRFRIHIAVIVLLLVFFGVLAYEIIDTLAQPEVRPGYVTGWRSETLRFHIEFILFALLVPLLGWLVGLPNRNAILRALQASP